MIQHIYISNISTKLVPTIAYHLASLDRLITQFDYLKYTIRTVISLFVLFTSHPLQYLNQLSLANIS